jgi:drug/metabolite transporter (DMT)-like permease
VARVRSSVALVLAIAAISTGAPFVRWAEPSPPLAIAGLRVAIAALLLAAAGARELPALRRLARRDAWLVVASGVLLGVHFATWVSSLRYTSTAASVVLVDTNPMFAAVLGGVLGDRVRPREWLGIAIAVAGVAIIAGGDWGTGGDAVLGDALALMGAAAAAGYLGVGRRLRDSMPLLPYLAAVNAIAAVLLLAATAIGGTVLLDLPGQTYLACAGAAVTASLLGHGLLNAAVRTTPTHLVALAVLGESVGSSLITWATRGEQPTLHAVCGGVVVLGGIVVGFVRRAEPAR